MNHTEIKSGDRVGGVARLDAWLSKYGMTIAMVVAWVATLGSLYFSDVMGFKPCRLCWFQRIFMYPLAVIIPVGILRGDRGIAASVLPLAAIGSSFSIYHVLLQKTTWFRDTCSALGEVPCSSDYIYWFGFITIPVLALTAFALILLTASAGGIGSKGNESLGDSTDASTRSWQRVIGLALAVLIAFTVMHLLRT